MVGSYDVDSVITAGKYEIQSKVKEEIMERLLVHDIGLMLVNITIQDSEPPTEQVMEAFKSVETAKQEKILPLTTQIDIEMSSYPKQKLRLIRYFSKLNQQKQKGK